MERNMEISLAVNILPKQNLFIKEMKKNKMLYLIMLPGMLYFIIFHYLPIYGIIIAFKDYKVWVGILESPWVGLKHFKEFINGEWFWVVLRNTLGISSLKTFYWFTLSTHSCINDE